MNSIQLLKWAKYTGTSPYLLMTWSGKYDTSGYRIFVLQFVNNTKVIDQLHVISGCPSAQKRPLLHPKDDYSGSGNSCPEGIYKIGQIIRMKQPEPGVGYVKIPIDVLPEFRVNNRSELLFHDDFNRTYSTGSMGCIVTYNSKDMERIISWCSQKARPITLVVDYGKGLVTPLSSSDFYFQASSIPKQERKINKAGLDLIKSFESCKLSAYRCSAGVLTIGWGHTAGVTEGMTITQSRADQLLSQDISIYEKDVSRLVKVPLTDNQFAALVSFAFNCGSDIDTDATAEGLGDSTLLKLLNAGNIGGAADQFLLWNKSNGKVLSGLTRRREAEKKLFLS